MMMVVMIMLTLLSLDDKLKVDCCSHSGWGVSWSTLTTVVKSKEQKVHFCVQKVELCPPQEKGCVVEDVRFFAENCPGTACRWPGSRTFALEARGNGRLGAERGSCGVYDASLRTPLEDS